MMTSCTHADTIITVSSNFEKTDLVSGLFLSASKLKKLTRKYSGGGGSLRAERSGAFVLIDHITTASRKDGKDPLLVGSLNYGQAKLWVTLAKSGTLGILGDIVISRAPSTDRGELHIEVLRNDIKTARTLTIAPIAVGGPYGNRISIKDGNCQVSNLPSGTCKLLLGDFDVRASRWDVAIVPGMIT